jgi:hypothetical protein
MVVVQRALLNLYCTHGPSLYMPVYYLALHGNAYSMYYPVVM